MQKLSRRDLLQAGAAGLAAVAVTGSTAMAATGAPTPTTAVAKEVKPMKDRWRISMNTATIRPASVEDKIKACAAAGFDCIELWQDDLAGWERSGKPLEDLAKRIKDSGMELADVIGFGTTMPPNEADRPKAIEDLKRRLAQAGKAGSKRIAVVPEPDQANVDLLWAAARYREILDVAKEFNVIPGLEFHGFKRGIHTLGQAAAIAIEADRPEACLIADTFHMYRGGSGFRGIALTSGALYGMFHINDLPKSPGQSQVNDGDRLYPGDGILPLAQIFKDLWKVGFRGPLSLEIFRQEEYRKPAADVAKTGMEKIRKVIAASGTES
jgi:2-keto-myo-inositol isomerase